jgi:hypothetical protein
LTESQIISQANAPLSSIMQVRFRDTYIPTYRNVSGQGNLFGIDVTMPLPAYRLLPVKHLTKLVIPAVITNPDSRGGIGDLRFIDLAILQEKKSFLWGVGPSMVLPTAPNRRFGQGKWQIGPAGGFALTSPRWIAGVLVQNPMSVGGNKQRQRVNEMILQPFATYQIGRGWFVRSQPQLFFDWQHGDKIFPVDLGVGSTFKVYGQFVSWYIQPYWNFSVMDRPYPRAGVTFGITFLYPNFWDRMSGLWRKKGNDSTDKAEI